MKQNYEIILASGSPRRRELLTQAGLIFRVMTADTDETTEVSEPAGIVEELSRRKAMGVYEAMKEQGLLDTAGAGYGGRAVIVAADTVVSVDGMILGKPGDARRAAEMLRSLSGRTHSVYTGVTLVYMDKGIINAGRVITFSERTGVSFYPLSDEEIEEYIATGEPMDKAGAYGIQGLGAELVEKIDGDYNNVVGLPLARVLRELKRPGTAGVYQEDGVERQ